MNPDNGHHPADSDQEARGVSQLMGRKQPHLQGCSCTTWPQKCQAEGTILAALSIHPLQQEKHSLGG